MKRSILAIASLILVLAAVPAVAGSPFGHFDGIPGGGNAGGGQIPLTGWGLDDDGVEAVDVYVDGAPAGRATYHQARPGVATMYPGFPDSMAAGWGFFLNSTHYGNGLHVVTIEVRSFSGEVKIIGSRVIEFTNTTHTLVPFGRIDVPLENTELFGVCDLDDPYRRYTVVSGYALDAGVEIGDLGVGYVELLIDGAIYANSRTSCFWSPATGGLTNCYGLRRLDVERQFPTLRDAPHSGFRFVLDLGYLMNFGYVPGLHTLTVRVGDIAGQVANIDEKPVYFFCDDFLPNQGSFGWIDRPQYGGINGNEILTLHGWSLDWEGIVRVEMYFDGEYFGDATRGIFRPRVNELYPGYPESLTSGWALIFDTNLLSDGVHMVQAIVVDVEGVRTTIGQRPITIVNH